MKLQDPAYDIIARNAIKMGNGDTMVDVSTAYSAIAFARKEEREKVTKELDEWIKVEDRLPKELEEVLVKNEGQQCFDVGFLLNGKWLSKVGKVTHWKKFSK